ncbi:unnamed protein product, partial [Staurois parvus]
IQTFFLCNFSLKLGHSVEVEGFIPEGSKRFVINMGKDNNNLVVHFEPRFDFNGDKDKIVLNSQAGTESGERSRRKTSSLSRRKKTQRFPSSFSKTRSPYNYLT